MKKTIVISALVTAMLASVTANAGEMVQGKDQKTLTVRASISAPSCSFDMNGGANVELGIINPQTMNLNSETRLEKKSGSFAIECDAKTMVQMSVIDTYAQTLLSGDNSSLFQGVHGPEKQFALVDSRDTSKLIGSYLIVPTEVTDENNGHHTIHIQGGAPINELRSTNEANQPAFMVFGNGNGVYQKSMKVAFNIEPSFLAKAKLGLGAEVEVVGETTFKMIYM